MTAALVDLEPRTGAIRFVGAGHVDTLILRANGETVTLGVHRHAAGTAAAADCRTAR